MKAKYSEKGSKGVIWVDCIECKRGPKGSGKDKCSAGVDVKKGGRWCCASGTLIDGLEI
jgi:hypothetical protein